MHVSIQSFFFTAVHILNACRDYIKLQEGVSWLCVAMAIPSFLLEKKHNRTLSGNAINSGSDENTVRLLCSYSNTANMLCSAH